MWERGVGLEVVQCSVQWQGPRQWQGFRWVGKGIYFFRATTNVPYLLLFVLCVQMQLRVLTGHRLLQPEGRHLSPPHGISVSILEEECAEEPIPEGKAARLLAQPAEPSVLWRGHPPAMTVLSGAVLGRLVLVGGHVVNGRGGEEEGGGDVGLQQDHISKVGDWGEGVGGVGAGLGLKGGGGGDGDEVGGGGVMWGVR